MSCAEPKSMANKLKNVRHGYRPSEAHVLIIQNPKLQESIVKFPRHFDSCSGLIF